MTLVNCLICKCHHFGKISINLKQWDLSNLRIHQSAFENRMLNSKCDLMYKKGCKKEMIRKERPSVQKVYYLFLIINTEKIKMIPLLAFFATSGPFFVSSSSTFLFSTLIFLFFAGIFEFISQRIFFQHERKLHKLKHLHIRSVKLVLSHMKLS